MFLGMKVHFILEEKQDTRVNIRCSCSLMLVKLILFKYMYSLCTDFGFIYFILSVNKVTITMTVAPSSEYGHFDITYEF